MTNKRESEHRQEGVDEIDNDAADDGHNFKQAYRRAKNGLKKG